MPASLVYSGYAYFDTAELVWGHRRGRPSQGPRPAPQGAGVLSEAWARGRSAVKGWSAGWRGGATAAPAAGQAPEPEAGAAPSTLLRTDRRYLREGRDPPVPGRVVHLRRQRPPRDTGGAGAPVGARRNCGSSTTPSSTTASRSTTAAGARRPWRCAWGSCSRPRNDARCTCRTRWNAVFEMTLRNSRTSFPRKRESSGVRREAGAIRASPLQDSRFPGCVKTPSSQRRKSNPSFPRKRESRGGGGALRRRFPASPHLDPASAGMTAGNTATPSR